MTPFFPTDLRRSAVSFIGALAVSALCIFGAVGPATAADGSVAVAMAHGAR